MTWQLIFLTLFLLWRPCPTPVDSWVFACVSPDLRASLDEAPFEPQRGPRHCPPPPPTHTLRLVSGTAPLVLLVLGKPPAPLLCTSFTGPERAVSCRRQRRFSPSPPRTFAALLGTGLWHLWHHIFAAKNTTCQRQHQRPPLQFRTIFPKNAGYHLLGARAGKALSPCAAPTTCSLPPSPTMVVKQVQSGGSAGTTSQGKGRGCGEVRVGQTRRSRGERPMGIMACGGRGFKETTRVSGGRPGIWLRYLQTAIYLGVMPNPPPPRCGSAPVGSIILMLPAPQV